MDDRPAVAICRPTSGYAARVPGSTREHCMVCAEEVWASPSSREVAEQYLCTDCAPGVLATEREPELMPLTPTQQAELNALDALDRQQERKSQRFRSRDHGQHRRGLR